MLATQQVEKTWEEMRTTHDLALREQDFDAASAIEQSLHEFAPVVARISGIAPVAPPARPTSRVTRRARAVANGHAPTADQVLGYLIQKGGWCAQSDAADYFGASRRTIRDRYTELMRDGKIEANGKTGAQKRWRAKEPVTA